MDTGVFSIYFGTERKDIDKSIRLTMQELKILREKPLGPLQLRRAKKQLSGQLIRSAENPENLIANMARTLMIFNKNFSVSALLEAIESLTEKDILLIANEILDPDRLSSLIFTGS
jgi:predicted Zn-dependent peptidase